MDSQCEPPSDMIANPLVPRRPPLSLDFALTKDDYLTHQLFAASRSERIRKKRRRSRILIPCLYFLMAAGFLFLGERLWAAAIGSIAVLWFFLYPVWSRWLYRRHYAAHIDENYRGRTDRMVSVWVEKDEFRTRDDAGEARIRLSELDRIDVIATHAFLRWKGGSTVILPLNRIQESDWETFLTSVSRGSGLDPHHWDWAWR